MALIAYDMNVKQNICATLTLSARLESKSTHFSKAN